MLSKRDKLLTQPWEERRFKDHRKKVTSALPVIDARTPASRPHVTLKLKKCQREVDRMDKILNDNFSLLQRLNNIMKVNRLENRWMKPLPKFQHKVGLFYDIKSLNDRISSRSAVKDSIDDAHTISKCYACDVKKKRYEFKQTPAISRESLSSTARSRESLPSTARSRESLSSTARLRESLPSTARSRETLPSINSN